jgi:CDP-diacylglycerol--glycerol-3-phosphate 3-phosphatidyltransferase
VLNRTRAFFTAVFTPLARILLGAHVPPDAVTVVGTVGVCAGALVLFPIGQLFWGVIVITLFVFSDTLDGVMARMSGASSTWGAYLDSTLDRFGDAAIFGGLSIWFFTGGHDRLLAILTLWCLVAGSITSYAKARAEALGMTANVGIAERADRLVSILVATGLSDFPGIHVPFILPVVIVALSIASPITVVQRMLTVRRQALNRDAQPRPAQPGSAQPGPAQPGPAQPGSAQPGPAQPGPAGG